MTKPPTAKSQESEEPPTRSKPTPDPVATEMEQKLDPLE